MKAESEGGRRSGSESGRSLGAVTSGGDGSQGVVIEVDVDEAAVLVVIAVLVDVGLERPGALVRPLVLGTEDVRARVSLYELALPGGYKRSRRHGTALHEIFRLAVRVHPIRRVVVVALAMAVNAQARSLNIFFNG